MSVPGAIIGVGDFSGSLVVGVRWTAFGPAVAFSYSALLFALGALLVARLEMPAVSHPENLPKG